MKARPNRNYFRLTRFILLNVSLLFQFISKFRKPEKRLLVVKIDAIGDYVLFRNYLQVLKESDKYKNYQVDLLGNIAWKDIAVTYDKDYINEFYFINEKDLYYSPLRVLNIGYQLYKNNYEIVIQPTYSRTLMGNGLAGLAAGKEAISFEGSNELLPRYKKKTDRLYSSLISVPDEIMHEYERNRYFFEQLLGKDIVSQGPSLPVRKYKEEGIVIFPGSRVEQRNWDREKFLEIIKRLPELSSEQIIIAGGESEIELSNYLMANLPTTLKVVNITGQLSQPNFIDLIANSKLLISNETGSVHIAVACSTPTICILGGGHFKRFTPYPENLAPKLTCVYQKMSCFNCNWECKYNVSESMAFPCISAIDTDTLWMEVRNMLT